MKKHCIQSMFVYMIRCAKKGHNNNAKSYSASLFGMVLYMRSVDDITEEEYQRIKQENVEKERIKREKALELEKKEKRKVALMKVACIGLVLFIIFMFIIISSIDL